MITIMPQVRVENADLLLVKAVTDNLEVSHNETEAKDLNIVNVSFRIMQFMQRFNHSPKYCYKGEHDINNIMEKMSINPHQSQQSNLYQ